MQWNSRKSRIGALVLAALTISTLVATQLTGRADDGAVESTARVLPVEVLRVEPVESGTSKRYYSGTVAARRSSDLGFERSARIESVRVEEGDTVAAGAVLARLDSRDLEIAKRQIQAQRAEASSRLAELVTGPRREVINASRARLDELITQRRLAEIQRGRRQELLARQAISKEEFDVLDFQVRSLKAAEDSARHQLDELLAGTRSEQVAMQRAAVQQLDARLASIELDLEKSILRAPFAGRVSRRLVDEGTVVSPGQPVISMVEQAAPEVRIGVPSAAIEALRKPQSWPVEVNGRTYSASFLSLLPELNGQTRSATVLLRLPAEAEVAVLPGQVARLEMEQELRMSGFWLPVSALVRSTRGLWACYALAEEPGAEAWRLERRDVEVLHQEQGRVLVRGTVSAGEQVVSTGVHRVSAGQLVRPANAS